jgi:hypothetical protein
MIRFFLLQNRQGKTRLTKWYQTPPDDVDRLKMEADVHRIVSMRGKSHTNFVEVLSVAVALIDVHISVIVVVVVVVVNTVSKLQAHISSLRGTVFHHGLGRGRQRAAADGDHPPIRRVVGSVLRQCY